MVFVSVDRVQRAAPWRPQPLPSACFRDASVAGEQLRSSRGARLSWWCPGSRVPRGPVPTTPVLTGAAGVGTPTCRRARPLGRRRPEAAFDRLRPRVRASQLPSPAGPWARGQRGAWRPFGVFPLQPHGQLPAGTRPRPGRQALPVPSWKSSRTSLFTPNSLPSPRSPHSHSECVTFRRRVPTGGDPEPRCRAWSRHGELRKGRPARPDLHPNEADPQWARSPGPGPDPGARPPWASRTDTLTRGSASGALPAPLLEAALAGGAGVGASAGRLGTAVARQPSSCPLPGRHRFWNTSSDVFTDDGAAWTARWPGSRGAGLGGGLHVCSRLQRRPALGKG